MATKPKVSHEICIFDTSVVLAIMAGETGSDYARQRLEGAFLSSINSVEVATRLIDWGYLPDEIDAMIEGLGLRVFDFTIVQALTAGSLRLRTRSKGLSLGDRA